MLVRVRVTVRVTADGRHTSGGPPLIVPYLRSTSTPLTHFFFVGKRALRSRSATSVCLTRSLPARRRLQGVIAGQPRQKGNFATKAVTAKLWSRRKPLALHPVPNARVALLRPPFAVIAHGLHELKRWSSSWGGRPATLGSGGSVSSGHSCQARFAGDNGLSSGCC